MFSSDQIEGFIKHKDERRPCVVYGASGCGKTSVLAKVAHQVSNDVASDSLRTPFE
jgi:Cdc6-like AAA superfamily ATPase